jgi:hypothetical protein
MINTALNTTVPGNMRRQQSLNRNQVAFQANTYEVKTAIDNGAHTCPHVMVHVKKLLASMQEIQKETDHTIKIPLIGPDIKESIAPKLKALPESTREKVLNIAELLGKPFGGCSGTCSKRGLTLGEVIGNVFAFWGIHSNYRVGNPFTIETTGETKLTKKELTVGIKKAEDPYEFIRETLKLQPLLSQKEKQNKLVSALEEIGVTSDQVNSRIVKKYL